MSRVLTMSIKSSFIDLLKEEDPKTLSVLYQSKTAKKIKSFVRRQGGSLENAEDVLVDSILRIIKLIQTNRYNEEGKFEAFFYQVGKWIWREELKRQGKRKIEYVYEIEESIEYELSKQEPKQPLIERIDELTHLPLILSFLKKNKRCEKIFQLRFVENYSLVEIQKDFDVSHANVNCKRCIERLRKYIKSFNR